MGKFFVKLSMIALLLLSVAGLGICQPSPGAKPNSFYVSEAKKIKVGQATEREVIALLGEPIQRDTQYRAGAKIVIERLYYGPTPQGGYVVVVVIDQNSKAVFKLLIQGKEQ
jgi:hypothetical protein